MALGGEAIEKDDDVSQYLDAYDYTYRVDSDFVQKCADMIIEHMKPIMENLEEMEKRRTKKKFFDVIHVYNYFNLMIDLLFQ